MKTDFADRFATYQRNVFPAMVQVLADDLGVRQESIEALEIGFHPGEQAWVFAERDDCGQIVGLLKRYSNGTKIMESGSKRGLIYQCVGTADKTGFTKRNKFIRCYTAKVDCPLCGKRKWCMVSDDNPHDPSAVICGHTEEGAVKHIEGSGYLHHLKETKTVKSNVLPASDRPVLVVEGPTDVLAAMDMGCVAVGRPNAESRSDWAASLLKGRSAIVVGENDDAGRRGMKKTFQALQALCSETRKVLPPAATKDLRAWHPTFDEFEVWLNTHGDKADSNKVLDEVAPLDLARKWLESEASRGKTRLIHRLHGDWFEHNGVYYEEMPDDEELDHRLYAFLDEFSVKTFAGKSVIVKPLRPDRRLVDNVTHALAATCHLKVPQKVYEPFYISKPKRIDVTRAIVFRNGIYDLTSETLKPLTPDIFITSTLPFDYDPHAKCPKCKGFYADILDNDEESCELMQEWMGYNAVAANHLQQMMFFFGVRGSGKSTAIRLLEGMLGKNRCRTISMKDLTSQFGLAPLVGKYAAIMSEDKVAGRDNADAVLQQLKRIIGGDTVSIDRKYREPINARLFCRFTYVANDLPAFDDSSLAFMRRVNLLYFGNDYYSSGPDLDLLAKLRPEAPGLAVWAMDGLRRLLANGHFTRPQALQEYTNELRDLTNPLCSMIDTCCTLTDLGAFTSVQQLYDLHKAFYEEGGIRPMNRTKFGMQFRNTFPKLGKMRRRMAGEVCRGYGGIAITPAAQRRYLERP